MKRYLTFAGWLLLAALNLFVMLACMAYIGPEMINANDTLLNIGGAFVIVIGATLLWPFLKIMEHAFRKYF